MINLMQNRTWRRPAGRQGGVGPGRPDDLDRLAGMTVAELGDEAGLLETVLDLAERQAAAARMPYAALVVQDGEVAGVGVNTVEEDFDPSAHAEVCAIRNAGIGDVVFAAPKELIPSPMGPVPDDIVRLIQAVTSVLPGQTRRGATPLSDARLARPFTVFAANGGGR